METIVITGASGFIGKSIAKRAANNKNYKVILISSSQATKPYTFINNFDEVPSGDILIHLSENSDRNIVNNTKESYIENTGMRLDTLLKKNFKKVIYFSSSAVYGSNGTMPYREDSRVYESDIYTKSKIANEKKVLDFGGIVARVVNVVGPNMSKRNVLSEIISQLNFNDEIIVKNEKPIRDFIWHEDLADAVMALTKINDFGIFNIGTGIGTSIKKIIEIAIKASGNSQVIHSLDKNDFSSYNVVNIDKIKNISNWAPKHTIESIIGEMISK